MKVKRILVFIGLTSCLWGQPPKPAPNSPLVLKNGTIVDVVSGNSKIGTVFIQDQRIQGVSFASDPAIPSGAIVYDLTGKTLIPGLIDGHVHISHGTSAEAKEHLLVALQNGVTAVRDMGGDGRMLTALRRDMNIQKSMGSDVFFSTIIAGPSFFKKDPRPASVAQGAVAGKASWQHSLTDKTDCRQIIAEAKGLGATAIKIYTGVDGKLIKKISEEAKRQGLKVWGHAAIYPSRPLEVIRGGIEAVSHVGDWLQYELAKEIKDRYDFKTREAAMRYQQEISDIPWDESHPKVKAILDAMRTNNSILEPTLFVYKPSPQQPGGAGNQDRLAYANRVTLAAYKAGVRISAGSDHMISLGDYGRTVNLHEELALLVNAGLSNLDAIRAATIVNAEVLGEEKNMGSIEKGKLANLVVLNGDPLKEIATTKEIHMVFKQGKPVDLN